MGKKRRRDHDATHRQFTETTHYDAVPSILHASYNRQTDVKIAFCQTWSRVLEMSRSKNALSHSGAGTNLKVRAPEFFLVRAPPLFGSKSTISRFGKCFLGGQYSLVSLLFAVLLLTVPPVPCYLQKLGARAPRALWSRRHCSSITVTTGL